MSHTREAYELVAAKARILAAYPTTPLTGQHDAKLDLIEALRGVWPPSRGFDVSRIDEDEEGLLVLEPRSDFDPCIIGIVDRFNQRFVLYSKRKVLDVLTTQLEGNRDEAEEWFSFNTNGGWYGDGTWAFLDDGDDL